MKYLIPFAFIICGSCTVRQVGHDNNDIRQVLMKNIDDQIMDNLIRGYRRLPIVHFDYGNIAGEITTTVGGSLNEGRSRIDTDTAGAGGALTSAVTAITRPETYTLTPSQAKKISVIMTPVNENNEVYEAYEAFLENQGLESTPHKPDPDVVHIMRRVEGRYYWVPKTKANDFFNLALVTTVKRGGPPATDPKTSDTPGKSGPAKSVSKSTTGIPELQSKAVSPPKSSQEGELKDIKSELQQLRIDQ